MENLVTANGKCQDHPPRWDGGNGQGFSYSLRVGDGCQVPSSLESWPVRRACIVPESGGPRGSAVHHSLPSTNRLLLLTAAVYRESS